MSSESPLVADAALAVPTVPVRLTVSGDFSFALNGGFRELLALYPPGERAFVVDLAAVSEVDTSALGMLLQLREHSVGGSGVTLINASPPVKAALAEAEVGRLFPVAAG